MRRTSSETAQRIAQDVRRLAYEQESALYDFRRGDGATLLLVLDRLDDPVTPLLTQWTYQVHCTLFRRPVRYFTCLVCCRPWCTNSSPFKTTELTCAHSAPR